MSSTSSRGRGGSSVVSKGRGRGQQTTVETVAGTNVHTLSHTPTTRGGRARGAQVRAGRGANTTFIALEEGQSLGDGSSEASDAGASLLTFGQHAGETFGTVLQSDPSYCVWAVSQQNPSPALAQFAAYVRHAQNTGSAENVTTVPSAVVPMSGSSSSSGKRPMDMDAMRAARLARLGGVS